jgi:hypothetical protein
LRGAADRCLQRQDEQRHNGERHEEPATPPTMGVTLANGGVLV